MKPENYKLHKLILNISTWYPRLMTHVLPVILMEEHPSFVAEPSAVCHQVLPKPARRSCQQELGDQRGNVF